MNWFKLISFWRADGMVGSDKPRFAFGDRRAPRSLGVYMAAKPGVGPKMQPDEKIDEAQVLLAFQRSRVIKI
ncbi:MAG: hypothetical protein AAFQ37_10635 [Bacteroidota bacterium]